MRLTDLAIKAAKPKAQAYRLGDGKGLYLDVRPSGGKFWRYRYITDAGKENIVSFGEYPGVGLARAREIHLSAHTARKTDGADPGRVRRVAREKRQIDAKTTFTHVAKSWLTLKSKQWSEDNIHRIARRLELHAYPQLGKDPITTITGKHVQTLVRRLHEADKHETAKRLLQYIDAILHFGRLEGYVSRVVTEDIDRSIFVRPDVVSHPRLQQENMGELFRAIDRADIRPQTRLALNLLFLTAVRTANIREALWSEIDFEKKQWVIPAEKMKIKGAGSYIVPLSRQALQVLTELYEINGDHVRLFPNQSRRSEPISENTLLYALNRMGYAGRQTPHGARGLFSTAANDSGIWDGDVIELCLAHSVGSAVRKAYNSAQRLKERAALFQWWADQIDVARLGAKSRQSSGGTN
jgi:integrase